MPDPVADPPTTYGNDPTADQGPFRLPSIPYPGAGVMRGMISGKRQEREAEKTAPGGEEIKAAQDFRQQEDEEHQRYRDRMTRSEFNLHKAEADERAAAARIPQQQLPGKPPDWKEYQKHAMGWAGAMAMMGALGAKAGRMSGTAALSAFNGALKGWQDGNLEAYTAEGERWKRESDRTIESNRQLMQHYQMVLDNAKLNVDQQRAEIERLAIENHDNLAYNRARAGDLIGIAQLQDLRHKWINGPEGLAAATEKMEANRQKGMEEAKGLMMKWGPYLGPNGEGLEQLPVDNATKAKLKFGFQQWPPSTWDITGRGGGGLSGLHLSQANQIRDQLRRELGREPSIEEVNRELAKRAATIREGATIGQRSGSLATVIQESKDIVPNVWDAAKASAGRGNAIWSAANAQWEVTKGDANFAYFVQQTNSLNHLYAQILSRTGRGTVHDLTLARESLNPSQPLSTIQGSLRAVLQDIRIAEKAPEKAMRKDKTTSEREQQTAKELGLGGSGGGAETGGGPTDHSKLSDDELMAIVNKP